MHSLSIVFEIKWNIKNGETQFIRDEVVWLLAFNNIIRKICACQVFTFFKVGSTLSVFLTIVSVNLERDARFSEDVN